MMRMSAMLFAADTFKMETKAGVCQCRIYQNWVSVLKWTDSVTDAIVLIDCCVSLKRLA